jgi:hypothetical protein
MEIIVQHYSQHYNQHYSLLDGPHNSPSCVICMEKLHNGQEHVGLPCHPSHCFHSECIQKWWNKNKSCPICRSSTEEHDQTPGATILLLSSPYRRSPYRIFPYRRGSQCIFIFFILMICFLSFLSCMALFGTLLTVLFINNH